MNRNFSAYLDIIRLLAAGFVFYAHSNVRFLIPSPLPLAEFAHSAVTVFFVLSGYVVAFVADQRESSLSSYTASRASRILSLSVLAVLLTPLLDMVGREIRPELYAANIPSDYWFIRVMASLLFLCEIWTISITTFSNIPYWSLNYEVWYYVLFGMYLFTPHNKKWMVIMIIGFALGPKIILLLPCWLAGVFAYRCKAIDQWSSWAAFLLWLVTVFAFIFYHYFDLMRAFGDFLLLHGGEWLHTQLHHSRYFAADWLLAIIISINFLAARRILTLLADPAHGLTKLLGKMGSLSYALYIMHFPLLYFWAAILGQHNPGWGWYTMVMLATFLSILSFGFLGEWLRVHLRGYFTYVFNRYDGLFSSFLIRSPINVV